MKMLIAKGHFKDELEIHEVVFCESEDVLPMRGDQPHIDDSGYWDEDIWYYGMSEEELTRIIKAKENIDGFHPVSFHVEEK